MELFGHENNKVLWGVAGNHFIEDPTNHEEIGLWGFDFNFFDKDEEGIVREGSSEFSYLLMLIRIWPSNWKTMLKRVNNKVDEDNGKALEKGNVRY